ncbi:MAG: DUF2071 domain-containing protein [Flavobacteriaceae bacterium]
MNIYNLKKSFEIQRTPNKQLILATNKKKIFFQEWENVVFLHYKVEKKALQLHVPKSLELD